MSDNGDNIEAIHKISHTKLRTLEKTIDPNVFGKKFAGNKADQVRGKK